MRLITYNFRLEDYDYAKNPALSDTWLDIRNQILCVQPSGFVDCYINYLELLNSLQSNWSSYGYLDMGMVPLAMPPSFLNISITKLMENIAKQIGLNYHSMPPVSFLRGRTSFQYNDYWMFREDLSKATGLPFEKATTIEFMRFCNEKISGFNTFAIAE